MMNDDISREISLIESVIRTISIFKDDASDASYDDVIDDLKLHLISIKQEETI